MLKVMVLAAIVFPAVASAQEAPSAAPGADPVTVDPGWSGTKCGNRWHHHWRRWDGSSGRFAVGVSKSFVDGESDGTARSFVARYSGYWGWGAELEMAKLSIGDNRAHTFGAALVKSFGHRYVRPYLIAGLGGGELDRADGTDSTLHYAEAGLGIMLRGRHLAVAVDTRRGVRHVDDAREMPVAVRMTTPGAVGEDERYTRCRVMALVFF